jgi:MSHA biogenesis protein MshL
MTYRLPIAALLVALLSACSNAPVQPPSSGHLRSEDVAPKQDNASIPPPVQASVVLPRPKPAPKVETYSVVVNNVRVQDLLFALARDAKVNVDIHPGITGSVTLNAIDQTLPQLLNRIAKQTDIRWEMDGPNLSVMPDKPFLRTYKVDFINMARTVKSTISTTTQIATGGTSTTSGTGSPGTGGNTATTSVTSDTKNDLMESLIRNVTDLLKEEDRIRYRTQIETEAGVLAKTEGTGAISAGLGSKKENPNGQTETTAPGASGSGNQSIDVRAAATKKIGEYEPSVSVFANRETGVLTVRATSRQHEKVQDFIDKVMTSATRQVLIEATIVEVTLSDNYKQGINWSALKLGAKGFEFTQEGTAGLPSANPLNIFTIGYTNPTSRLGNLAAQVSLLESFGNVRVLSSPKISVMNNQTATLKVADNKVYFTVSAVITPATPTTAAYATYNTTPNVISVGFVMNVTPQINDTDTVTINVRPTITRIVGYAKDPNPDLAKAGVTNNVPEIQTREMESIIKIDSGQIAVMGGLMQDGINKATDAVPGLSEIPLLGNFFKNRNDTNTKTELVIFLRPTVIHDSSINGDYSNFRAQLPNKDFFETKGTTAKRTEGELQ